MSKPVIVIDVMNLTHRNFHALKHSQIPNPLIYGMLRDICTLQERFGSTEFMFCFDGPDSLRKKEMPSYKDSRPDSQNLEMGKQVDRLHYEVLAQVGFNNRFCHCEGEADDLIAWLVDVVDDPMILVSSDKDLFQLVSDDVTIWEPIKKVEITPDVIISKYGLRPDQWVEYRAMMGDISDNIPGIPGVGAVRALNYLSGKMHRASPYRKVIEDGRHTMLRNSRLMRLPYEKLDLSEQHLREDSTSILKWNMAISKLGYFDLTGRFKT